MTAKGKGITQMPSAPRKWNYFSGIFSSNKVQWHHTYMFSCPTVPLHPRLCFPSRYGVSWSGYAVSPVCESLGAGALVGLGVCVPVVSVPERKGERWARIFPTGAQSEEEAPRLTSAPDWWADVNQDAEGTGLNKKYSHNHVLLGIRKGSGWVPLVTGKVWWGYWELSSISKIWWHCTGTQKRMNMSPLRWSEHGLLVIDLSLGIDMIPSTFLIICRSIILIIA